MIRPYILAAIVAASPFLITDDMCATDSECLAQCEREEHRACTDDDVFGAPCDELPLDHPDYCERNEQ